MNVNQNSLFFNLKSISISLIVAFPLALSACGGGSDNSLSIGSTETGGGGTGTGGGNTTDNGSENSSSAYKQAALSDKNNHTAGTGVTVAVNDSGIDTSNAALKEADITAEMLTYSNGVIFMTPTQVGPHTSNEADGAYHGTEMAQIIFATAPSATITGSDLLLSSYGGAALYKGGRILAGQYGAKIINNSWGSSIYGADNIRNNIESYSYSADADDVKAVVTAGSLWLQATGNEASETDPVYALAKTQPNVESLLPAVFSGLEDGFIAVTAVDYSSSTTKSSYANPCGEAAPWCVAAPARYTVTLEDGSTGIYGGTSNSTAYVSGVAATVWSRYPWMTNKNIKDVILGTATDLGDTGVDSIFGWGLVNASKAQNGYGQFSWETSTLNVTDGTYYFDNDITGTGGFEKRGTGKLVLNGNNTFSGDSSVTAGTLVLNGANTASFTVGNAGTLAVGDERNISSGSIVNNGTLSAETDSNLIINGNYTQSPDAVLNKYLGSILDIRGTASLAGTLNLTGLASNFVPATGTYYDIMTATGGITGQFSTVNSSNGLLNGEAEYLADAVRVSVERSSVVSTPSAKSYETAAETAKQVDTVIKEFDRIYAENGALSDTQREFYAKVYGTESVSDLNNVLFSLDRSIYMNNLYNASLEQAESNKWLADQTAEGKDAVWANVRHSNARTDFSGMSGKKNNTTVDIGGVKALTANQSLGLQLSVSDQSWKDRFDGSTHTADTDHYGLSIAYSYNINDFRLFGLAGYARLDSDITTDIRRSLNADQYSVGVGGDKVFTLKNFQITPGIMVQYLNTSGDDVKGQVYDIRTKQVVASFSVKLGYQISKSWNLSAKMGIDHDLQQNNTAVNEYAGVRVNSSVDLPKTRYYGQLGVRYDATENVELGANYRYSGSKRWNENSASVYFKYKF